VFCNTEFGSLKFTPIETAILCELLVRGPQTPGELRTRAARMCELSDVSQIESALQSLQTRPDGPFVAQLARESGRRDSRYAQLFCGDVPNSISADAEKIVATENVDDEARLARLEKLVDQLVREVADLKQGRGKE
jgi:uncharacterized protein YceH (UPF0502 family)